MIKLFGTVGKIEPRVPVPSKVTPEIRRPNDVLKSGKFTLKKNMTSRVF